MHRYRAKAVLFLLGGTLALGLLALVWAIGTGSSEAQQGAMHNCPQPGKWAISVWSGQDGTDTGEALATCGEEAVDFAYYIDPETQQWLRYFVGRTDISNLLTLANRQGVIAHGAMGAAPPSPTPTPSVGGFSISNESGYIRSMGTLHVVGEVKNNNPFDAEFVKISATFFDAEDNVVAADFTYSCLDVLPAGGDSPFNILLLDPPANIDRYTLQAYDEPADEPPPSGLVISSTSTHTDSIDLYHVTGLVTNDSTDTYEFVKICGALYSAAGDVIRAGSTYAQPDTLAPGQSGSFDFSEFIDSTPVASYRLWVDGERW